MGYKDKEKQREYQRRWQKKQRELKTKYYKRQRELKKIKKYRYPEWYKNRREKIKVFIAEWRDTHRICFLCGKEFTPSYLELHHPLHDGRGTLFDYATSLESIKKEINRCILLCRKCHKREHNRGCVDSIGVSGQAQPTREVKFPTSIAELRRGSSVVS